MHLPSSQSLKKVGAVVGVAAGAVVGFFAVAAAIMAVVMGICGFIADKGGFH